MLLRYPYNLYEDIKNVKGSTLVVEDVFTLEDDDVLEKFFKYGTFSDKNYIYLSKYYKEYKTLRGISVECDVYIETIKFSIRSAIFSMALVYEKARSTDFGTKFTRDTEVRLVPNIHEYIKDNLVREGYVFLGDIKDSFGDYRRVKGVGGQTEKYLEEAIKDISYSDTGKFLVIREENGISEGVVYREGKDLIIRKFDTSSLKDLFNNIVYFDGSAFGFVDDRKESRITRESLEEELDLFMMLSSHLTKNKAQVFFDKGFFTLNDITKLSKYDIVSLEGIGPNTLKTLENALRSKNMFLSKTNYFKKDYESIKENKKDNKDTEDDYDVVSELPDGFIKYLRNDAGKTSSDLCVIDEFEICDCYVDYLRKNNRNIDLQAYTLYEANYDKKGRNAWIISTFDRCSGGFFKVEELLSDKNLKVLYDIFIQVYYSDMSLDIKKDFLLLCKMCTKKRETINLGSISDFIRSNHKGYSYDIDTLFNMYCNLYD